MSSLFYSRSFNADISRWDTSSVTNMYRMFYDARAFNQDIGTWDTSSVTTMYAMFYQAYAFNQHLSRWDVSSVTTMRYMFYDANAFNTMPEGWDTSKVTDSTICLLLQTHGMRGSGRQRHTLPGGGWTSQGQRVRRVPSARQRRRRHLHRHPRERHVLRPHVQPGYVLEGVTSCTDRVLTEWLCASRTSPPGPSSRRRWTRASAINCAK